MRRKLTKKYSEEDLLRAVAEIKNRKCTYRIASVKYGIPVSTLYDKVTERSALSSKRGTCDCMHLNITNSI